MSLSALKNTKPWDALERAIALAMNAHIGQRDKAGQPYILHLLRVMESVSDPFEKQAGVLHDYLEDTAGTVDELRRNEISDSAIQAIILLTRVEGQSYCDYVIELNRNAIAKQAKLADLEDNYRIGRVAYRAGHETEDAMRMQRYALSYQFLKQAIGEHEYRDRMQCLE